jgi:hypothetical protein
VNVLARRVARKAWASQRHFSKTAVSEQASGTGLPRPDAQVGQPGLPDGKSHTCQRVGGYEDRDGHLQ